MRGVGLNMSGNAFDCDVLVVGLGPVGAALAALLARRGVSVIAVERDTVIYPLPRAVHFDHEIMRLFQELGIADEVARHSIALPPYEFRTADGQLLMRFPPEPDAHCGWASGYMFHQPSLEEALREHRSPTGHRRRDAHRGSALQGLATGQPRRPRRQGGRPRRPRRTIPRALPGRMRWGEKRRA